MIISDGFMFQCSVSFSNKVYSKCDIVTINFVFSEVKSSFDKNFFPCIKNPYISGATFYFYKKLKIRFLIATKIRLRKAVKWWPQNSGTIYINLLETGYPFLIKLLWPRFSHTSAWKWTFVLTLNCHFDFREFFMLSYFSNMIPLMK